MNLDEFISEMEVMNLNMFTGTTREEVITSKQFVETHHHSQKDREHLRHTTQRRTREMPAFKVPDWSFTDSDIIDVDIANDELYPRQATEAITVG